MRTLAAAIVAACALLVPANAVADGDIAIIGDRLFVSYADNTAASALLALNQNGNRNYVLDEDSVMTPQSPCTPLGPAANRDWECPGEGLFFLTVAGSKRGDLFQMGSGVELDVTAAGEEGDDDIHTASGDDQLSGNKGDDQLSGGPGSDVLSDGNPTDFGGTGGHDMFFGEGGNDLLDGGQLRLNGDSGSGHDVMDGGPDFDTADYSRRTAPLTITEDGNANDGQSFNGTSEGDNVTSAEQVLGGSAGDRITGGPEDNRLLGNRGADLLAGGLGADVLAGGPGVDAASYAEKTARVVVTLDDLPNDGVAGEGDDVAAGTENVVGGSAGDLLVGDSGANALVGLGGQDTLDARGGDDLIDARDGGADALACGTGVDQVLGDLADVVPADCEGARVGTKSLGRLKLGASAAYAGGKLGVKVSCPKGPFASCTAGKLVVSDAGKQLGSAGFTVVAGKTASIKVSISAAKLGARKSVAVAAVARGAIGATRRGSVKH